MACFDVLHAGHVEHLEAACRLGDELWVSVTKDEFVNKGPNKPWFPVDKRMKVIDALWAVDVVFPCDNLIQALQFAKPDILVKGADYVKGLDQEHADYCREHNIRIVITSTPKISASDYIKMED